MNSWPLITYDNLTTVHGVTTDAGPDFKNDSGLASRQFRDRLLLEKMAWVEQVHGGDIIIADGDGCIGKADALVTETPGQGLLVRGADCPLLLLSAVGNNGRAVGVVHASWRSTVREITRKTVALMAGEFGADPTSMDCVIVPSAGPCCYEVGADVATQATDRLGPTAEQFFRTENGKLFFDLWKANADQLHRCGVPPHRINVSGICTICCDGTYPSYRRDGINAGRFAAGIGVGK
ncbi:polyphenol oxidase family protein [bacterium]|nr:polyphenol oxidase family protein [bacterium]MBT7310580.1 polyphenol oxidase family protein [bacterium]